LASRDKQQGKQQGTDGFDSRSASLTLLSQHLRICTSKSCKAKCLSRSYSFKTDTSIQAKIMQPANCNTAAPDNRDPAMPQSPPQTPSPKKKKKAGTAKAKIPNVKKRNRAMSEGSDDVGLHNKRGSEVQPEVEFGEYIEAETKLDEDAGIAALLDGGELW